MAKRPGGSDGSAGRRGRKSFNTANTSRPSPFLPHLLDHKQLHNAPLPPYCYSRHKAHCTPHCYRGHGARLPPPTREIPPCRWRHAFPLRHWRHGFLPDHNYRPATDYCPATDYHLRHGNRLRQGVGWRLGSKTGPSSVGASGVVAGLQSEGAAETRPKPKAHGAASLGQNSALPTTGGKVMEHER